MTKMFSTPYIHKTISRVLLTTTLLLALQQTQAAEIIPLVGIRGGGDVIDETTNQKHSINTSNVIGFILAKPYEYGKTLEIYYSHQSSELSSVNVASSPTFTSATEVPLSIDYLHFGGTTPISTEEAIQTFLSGGIGFTYLSPDITGLDSELRASMSIGIGLKWPLTKRIALRFETRGLATLFNNNSSIFCNGGCTLKVNGNFFTQYEALAGLSFSF